jgi:hypothetical protein
VTVFAAVCGPSVYLCTQASVERFCVETFGPRLRVCLETYGKADHRITEEQLASIDDDHTFAEDGARSAVLFVRSVQVQGTKGALVIGHVAHAWMCAATCARRCV